MLRSFVYALVSTLAMMGLTQAQAEYLIHANGDILTMDGDEPSYAEAVVTRDGKIIFVGREMEASQKFPDASRKDLQGKTMLPGFIDAHGHFMFALNMVNQVNVANPPVGPSKDIPSTIEAVKAHLIDRAIPKGKWLVGWDYDPEELAEGRHITKADLDPHFPDHKVMLIHVSGHGAVLNSNALAWVEVTGSTSMAIPPLKRLGAMAPRLATVTCMTA